MDIISKHSWKCSKELSYSETVEKVPKQSLEGDAEKNDLTEFATINDLTIMRDHETPKNHLLTILRGFSTPMKKPLSREKDFVKKILSCPAGAK